MRTRSLALATLFSLAVVVPSIALAADQAGHSGAVTKVEVNTPSSDAYLQFHGRVFIQLGKNTTTEYRWGGTSCGSRILDADMVDVLLQAASNSNTRIAPTFQDGQGAAKCIVGLTVTPR